MGNICSSCSKTPKIIESPPEIDYLQIPVKKKKLPTIPENSYIL